jgi:hypothetical protein
MAVTVDMEKGVYLYVTSGVTVMTILEIGLMGTDMPMIYR